MINFLSISIISILFGWLLTQFISFINIDLSNISVYSPYFFMIIFSLIFILIFRKLFIEFIKRRKLIYIAKTIEKRIYFDGELISATDFAVNKYSHDIILENNFFKDFIPKLKKLSIRKILHYRKFIKPSIVLMILVIISSITNLFFSYKPSDFIDGKFPVKQLIKIEKKEANFYLSYPSMIIHGENAKIVLKSNYRDKYISINSGENENKEIKMITDSYTVINPDKDFKFNFKFEDDNNTYKSLTYNIKVHKLPFVEKLEYTYIYPHKYGIKSKLIKDNGNIEALIGTQVELRITASEKIKNAYIWFKSSNKFTKLETEDNIVAKTKINILKDDEYQIVFIDELGFKNQTNNLYAISTIKDLSPKVNIIFPPKEIHVKQANIYKSVIEAYDDYGINSLKMHYNISDSVSKKRIKSGSIDIKAKSNVFTYKQDINLQKINLKEGQTLSYFVSIVDISGKTDKSLTHEIIFDSVYKQIEKENQTQTTNLEKAINEQEEVKKEIEKLVDKMASGVVETGDEQKIKELIQKEEKINEKISETIESLKKTQEIYENKEQSVDEELIQKNEEIQKLLDELLDQKTKDNIKKLQRQIANMNKDKKDSLKETKDIQEEQLKRLEKVLDMLKLIKEMQDLNQAKDTIDKTISAQKQLNENLIENKKRIIDELTEVSKGMNDIEKLLDPQKKKYSKDSVNEILDDFKKNAKKSHLAQKNELKSGTKKEAINQGEKTLNELNKMSEDVERLIKQLSGQDKEEALKLLKLISQESRELGKKFSNSLENAKKEQLQQRINGNMSKGLKKELIKNLTQANTFMKTRKREFDKKCEGIVKDKKNVLDNFDELSNMLDELNEDISEEQLFRLDKSNQNTLKTLNKISLEAMKMHNQLKKEMESKSQCNKGNKPGGQCNKPGDSPMPDLNDFAKMQEQLNKDTGKLLSKIENGGELSEEQKDYMKKLAENQSRLKESLSKVIKANEKCSKENGKGEESKDKTSDKEGKQTKEGKENKNGKDGIAKAKEIEKKMEEISQQLSLLKLDKKTAEKQKEILDKLLKYSKGIKEGKKEDKKRKATAVEIDILTGDQNALEKELQEFLKKQNFNIKSNIPGLSTEDRKHIKEYFDRIKTYKY